MKLIELVVVVGAAVVCGLTIGVFSIVIPAPVPARLVNMSVLVITDTSSGSGTLFGGYVLTAAHVVGTSASVEVCQDSGGFPIRRFSSRATVVRVCAVEDIALLRVDSPEMLPDRVSATLGSAVPAVGEPVFHVGSFLGKSGSQSFSLGYVAKDSRASPFDSAQIRFQFSGPSYPGSSGGGVFTGDGRLVGIVVEAAGPSLVLCIPVETILRVARREGLYEILK